MVRCTRERDAPVPVEPETCSAGANRFALTTFAAPGAAPTSDAPRNPLAATSATSRTLLRIGLATGAVDPRRPPLAECALRSAYDDPYGRGVT
jgi:hypothetical protein